MIHRTRIPLIALLLCSVLWSMSARAETFDESCAPRVELDPARRVPQLAVLIHDDVALASESGEGATWRTLHESVTTALGVYARPGTCADDRCDPVHIGLGFTSADTWVMPDEDTSEQLGEVMSGHTPAASQTADALTSRLTTPTLWSSTNATRQAVVVLTSPPSVTTAVSMIRHLCAAQRAAQPVFTRTIGLGSFSSLPDPNTTMDTTPVADPIGARVLATLDAAGGSGRCVERGTEADGAAEIEVDVCAMSDSALVAHLDNPSSDTTADTMRCAYARIATDEPTLTSALLDAAEASRCVFPLEHPANTSEGDPLTTAQCRVRVDHALFGADLPIPAGQDAFASQLVTRGIATDALATRYEGSGWKWLGARRRAIQLTGALCADVRRARVSRVETQLACRCQYTGQDCAVPGETGRCAAGRYVCVQGIDVCTPRYEAMPELCNGLDDNCDGLIDNLSSANPARGGESAWNASTQPLDAETQGAFCGFEDVCSCPDGARDTYGPEPGAQDDPWTLYLSSYSGACMCKAPLSVADDAPHTARPTVTTTQTCASAPLHRAIPPHAWLALLALALIPARRRRRITSHGR